MTTTIEDVYKHLLTDPFYEDVLKKYLKNKTERDEFRQEIWMILLEMPKEKLIYYYDTINTNKFINKFSNSISDNRLLKSLFIRITNNQIKSNTSPWHRKFRQPVIEYNSNNLVDDCYDDINNKINNEIKISFIESNLTKLEEKDPYLRRDITIFKMHIYDNLSYRKISKKTNISTTSVGKYVNNVIRLLKLEKIKLKNYE